mmetsp:Transcript_111650/g.360412  ORF Transcript_111650/g.360412 Transcript_111650/m.360412 type:complete len:509 (+) Transcript_111650:2-1528(+)
MRGQAHRAPHRTLLPASHRSPIHALPSMSHPMTAGRLLRLCCAWALAPSARGQAAGERFEALSLLQSSVTAHFHRFSSRERALVASRMTTDSQLWSAVTSVLPAQRSLESLILEQASRMLSPSQANVSRWPSGGGAGSMGMPSGGGGQQAATDPAQMMQQMEVMLDALGSDDFIRNFTKMCGEAKDLARQLEQAGSAAIDAFLAKGNTTSPEVFLDDAGRIIRELRHMQLDFMQQLVQSYADFAVFIPVSTSNYTETASHALSNMTAFVNAFKSIPPPNTSEVNGLTYCPALRGMTMADPFIERQLQKQLKKMNVSKRMLPTMGQSFASMLGDDAESQVMTPRLLFVVSEMTDFTYVILESWGRYNHRCNWDFADFVQTRLDRIHGGGCSAASLARNETRSAFSAAGRPAAFCSASSFSFIPCSFAMSLFLRKSLPSMEGGRTRVLVSKPAGSCSISAVTWLTSFWYLSRLPLQGLSLFFLRHRLCGAGAPPSPSPASSSASSSSASS